MNKEIPSFQENIRKTFLLLSVTPVIVTVLAAIIVFIITWGTYLSFTNKRDCSQIASDTNDVITRYYSMLMDMEDVITENGGDAKGAGDRLFSLLYECTADYDDIGNLMVFTPDRKVIFSSKNSIPEYLTREEYDNWGVWNRIKKYPGLTKTTLYSGNLYITRGVYQGKELEYALVYAMPSQVIANIVNARNRTCVVTDSTGWVYLSNAPGLTDEFGQINAVLEAGPGYAKLNGQRYVCSRASLGKGLTVYTFVDLNRSIRITVMLMVIIAVIFLGIILITFRSTRSSSEVYTRDVKKIEDAFEEVSRGNLDVSLNIGSSKEFQIIGNDFNEMIDGLKDQIDRNRELAQNAAFSQVKQLESQFNPHFLFNTLDNIRFMARIDAAAADKMILSLSGLLRYSIRETREEVTVSEDLQNLQFYLNILQIRFNKRFAYNINVAEDIGDCLIPKLLLQPLLENAVKYGFGEKEKLTVNINGYQIRENLIFVCEDDGVGIDEEQLNAIKEQLADSSESSAHFGLYNIHRRIRLMYNGDYGLDISSKKGEGTVVRLTLPKKTEDKKQ